MKVLRLLIGVGAVVAVACLASVAWGAERPDDRAGPLGVGAAATASEQLPFESYGTADTIEARIKAGLTATGGMLAATRPDDRAGEIGVGAIEPGTYRAPTAEGIDWTDPLAFGMLAVLAAVAVFTAVYVTTHRRHGGTGTTGPGRPAATH